MSLQWVGQDDFSAGWLVGVGQDQLPGVGLYGAFNALFDDDGDVYRRGGVTRFLSLAAAPTFLWSGWLGTTYCLLIGNATKMWCGDGVGGVNTTWWFVTDLGGPGVARPVRPAIVSDLIFLPTGFVWGGSTKAAYSTGTITTTVGSPIVTGAGTAFAANVEAGMFFTRAGGNSHRIKSVDSATQITLETPSTVAVAGSAYSIANTLTAGLKPTVPLASAERHLGAIFNRLVIGAGNIVTFSKAGDPFTFDPTDYHKLPDGVRIVGIASIRDLLLVFTDAGLWSISGLAFDLTDDAGNPQQNLQRLTPEISLAEESGIVDWAGSLIVPCTDRVFLVDGLAPPVPISDSIQANYQGQFTNGARPGGAAVYRNHLFLPFMLGAGASYAPWSLLVCRLNRPVRSRQTYYAWSTWSRAGANLTCLATDSRDAPILRGGQMFGAPYVIDMTHCFPPFSETQIPPTNSDWDGNSIDFDITIRDLPTGNGQPNHVRRMRIGYEAVGTGLVKGAYTYGTEPLRYQGLLDTGTYAQVNAAFSSYSVLLRGYNVAAGEWALDNRNWHDLGAQSVLAGVEPIEWDFPVAERTRYIAGRIRVTDPLVAFKLRKLQFAIRPATHQR